MTGKCLYEEELIELFYAESQSASMKEHLAECSLCQTAFARICSELIEIDLQVPDGGQLAVSEALALIDRRNGFVELSEILTLEEVAQWLKVSNHNIRNMLHMLPHTIIDGNIRFDRKQLTDYLFAGNPGAEKKAPDQSRQRLISLPGRKVG